MVENKDKRTLAEVVLDILNVKDLTIRSYFRKLVDEQRNKPIDDPTPDLIDEGWDQLVLYKLLTISPELSRHVMRYDPHIVLLLQEQIIRMAQWGWKRYTDEQTLAGGKVATEGDETETGSDPKAGE